MQKVSNHNIYLSRMQAGILDKLFFVQQMFHCRSDKVPDIFIDFGCADGSLIHTLRTIWPNCTFIGYDIDKESLTVAKRNLQGVIFTDNWAEIVHHVVTIPGSIAINLSSVLHEVYTYCSGAEQKEIITNIVGLRPDYILIRDMFYPAYRNASTNPHELAKIYAARDHSAELRSFEKKCGDIHNTKTAMHFLLKYRYSENWVRELDENYFSVPSCLACMFPNYNAAYRREYIHPYTAYCVKRDFGVELKDDSHKTHIDLILTPQSQTIQK